MPTKFENMIMDQYVQTAYGPADDFTQMGTEMAGGTEPAGATPMTLKEFATSAADVPAGLLKGAIQGTLGIAGDIESIVYGVRELFKRGADEGRLDAFLRGIGEGTVLPTTEDVKKWMDTNVGPLVPAGASERRREAAKIPEFVGELGGAGQTVIEGSRAAARGVRQIGREIATEPPIGAVQMAPTPVQAPKSEIGFYSAVEETVANLPQAKGAGQQFLAQISKTAGVKPDEIKWTGLDEFLKGKKSVTKAEVQDYLAANRVDVQEVRLSDEIDPNDVYRFMEDEAGEGYSYAEALDMLRDYGGESTKFSKYTLPGGENYREILLTLPAKQLTEAEARSVLNAAPDARLSQADIDFASRKQMQDYRSSHFDQPNILAHLRVNDRTIDGKKTLFVEEIQSDWHQAGREKGYADAGKPYEVFDPKDGNVIATFKTEQEAKAYADELGPNVDYAKSEGVPDAPFKTSWHELSLKRAIQEASEKGYDQIAFTTGKTQAERYDLSKQVRSIGWQESDRRGATKLISIEPYEGNTIELPIDSNGVVLPSTGSQFDGKRVDEVVGKEVAEKIMGGNNGSLSGSGLQVGGEGMKGFYDNILPKSLEKLGKKFDAKVGKAEMDGVEVWQMDITPKMRESAISKGQPLFVAPVVAPGMVQDEESK